jgi:Na+/glutamate symporter
MKTMSRFFMIVALVISGSIVTSYAQEKPKEKKVEKKEEEKKEKTEKKKEEKKEKAEKKEEKEKKK